MQKVYELYRMMLAESAIFHEKDGNSQLASVFRNAQGKLRDSLKLRDNPAPVVAFVGLTNAGKSTLLSALFGAKVAPSCNRPWSSVPVEYRYSEQYEINAEFSDTIETATDVFSSADQMLEAIEKFATAKEDAGTRMLYAKMPALLLKDGLVIADTPGFGAAATAGGEGHGASLLNYLPRVDYIYWVIKSLQGITKVELDFYQNYLQGRCDNIVVNCFDEYNSEEQQEFIRVNGRFFTGRINWYFVDAKAALKGKFNNIESLLNSSGINAFEQKILSLNPTEKRLDILRASVSKFFRDLKRYKSTCKVQMFFVEHRRLQLEHELAKHHEESEILDAIRASIN